MAKKRAEKPEMQAAPAGIKPVRVDLTDDDHKLLRLVAASEGKSMAAFARDTLIQVVKDLAKQRGLRL